MIYESVTPINFYKIKAHIGVIGNESANTIAKHAARYMPIISLYYDC